MGIGMVALQWYTWLPTALSIWYARQPPLKMLLLKKGVRKQYIATLQMYIVLFSHSIQSLSKEKHYYFIILLCWKRGDRNIIKIPVVHINSSDFFISESILEIIMKQWATVLKWKLNFSVNIMDYGQGVCTDIGLSVFLEKLYKCCIYQIKIT